MPPILPLVSALFLVAAPAVWAQSAAAVTTPVATTRVLAIAHITKESAAAGPSAFRSIMPSEVKATVDLYLAGKKWYVRQDGQGVVFLLNATSTEQAESFLQDLPLVRAHRLAFDFMPLGPLSPLRYLTGEAPSGDTH